MAAWAAAGAVDGAAAGAAAWDVGGYSLSTRQCIALGCDLPRAQDMGVLLWFARGWCGRMIGIIRGFWTDFNNFWSKKVLLGRSV